MLLEGSLDMIWQAKVKDGRHRFVYCSPSSVQTLGWSVEEIAHLPLEAMFTPESMLVIAEDVERISSGQPTSMVQVEAVRKDGHHIWLENKVRLLDRAPDGELSVVIYIRDVTERKRLQDQFAKLALIDGLTGIENRRAFDLAIDREWKRTLHTGLPLSLLLFDVDHFKPFNDTYGHQVGDDCHRAIACALRSAVNRPGDVVARYDGEEFVVLLPATDIEGAEILANRLCYRVADLRIPHSTNDARGVVTISGGVSTALARFGGTIKMPEGLLLAADAALYKAKHEGRNRIATSFLLVQAHLDENTN
jgi:diguanylate cyclase (GGDEF)-like protein/PAS domain S-box-containing protein